jgi:hemerythrin superfamily protein
MCIYILSVLKTNRIQKETTTATASSPTMTNSSNAHNLVNGQRTIHNVIRRNLQLISEYKAEDYTEKEQNIFVEHVKNFMILLQGHHETEEGYWFPTISKACNIDLKHFELDHKELDILWTQISENLETFRRVLLKDRPQHLVDLRQMFIDLQSEMLPHLQAEEDFINAELLEQHLTESEMKKIEKNIVRLAKAHMGRAAVGLPLYYFSLNNEEQARVKKEVPWIVTRVLIPVVWKKQYSKFIPLYHNHPKNTTNA